MKNYFLLLAFVFSPFMNIFSQSVLELYPKYLSFGFGDKLHGYDIKRINGNEDQIFMYEQENFHLYKDSLTNPEKIRNVEIRFTQDLDLQQAFNDLSLFPEIFYLKLNNLRFGDPIQKSFPKDLSGIKNVVFINFYGSFDWDYESLFGKLQKLSHFKHLALYGLGKEKLKNVDLKALSNLEGLALSGREGATLPNSVSDLVNLKALVLSADLYPDFREQFRKLSTLPRLKQIGLSNFRILEGDYSVFGLFTEIERLRLRSIKTKDLDGLFASLSKNENLLHLDVFNTESKTFPATISKFKNLEYLKLERLGEDVKIDNQVYTLGKLKTLIISSNKNFEEVSPQIADLRNLEELTLNYNKIRSLPSEIGALTKLKKLDARNNEIEAVPVTLGRLSNLEVLNLDNNKIKSLPETIGGLKNLRQLNLNTNLLSELPTGVSNLSRLERLYINNNDLTELPTAFGELGALEELFLQRNLIEFLPGSFGALSSLKNVELQNNNLKELPLSFGSLRNLRSVKLGNKGSNTIERYNFELGKFVEDSLRKPRMKNAIRFLPESFSRLEEIKLISLSENPIEENKFYEILKKLEAKRYSIYLENSGIAHLPSSGWENILVENLYLSGNQISALPKNIIDAPFLRNLYLNSNPVGEFSRRYDNKEKLLIAFHEAGFIEKEKLPRTAEMAQAYLDLGYGKGNHQKQLRFFENAFEMDSLYTAKNIRKDDYADALLEAKNFHKAIEYYTNAIQKDTAQNVRILNFIVPQFKNRAKAYLALGDTIAAIKDLKTVSSRFNSPEWGEAALLAKEIKRDSMAKELFREGVKFYQERIKWNRENNRTDFGYQLSLLELYIISEDLTLAKQYYNELREREINKLRDKILLGYFDLVLGILDGDEKPNTVANFKQGLGIYKGKFSGWSFELFQKWLKSTEIEDSKRDQIILLTNFLSEQQG